MSIKAPLLRPDRAVITVEMDEHQLVSELPRVLECHYFTIVSLEHNIDVVVDDEGLLVADPELNLAATILIHTLGGKTAIFGNAVLVGSTPSGETVELTAEQNTIINEAINRPVDEDVRDAIVDTLRPMTSAAVIRRS